jgi:hypothetical protein
MAARALFAGPGALRGLRRGRPGVVELVLARGAYVRLGDDWLLVAEPNASFGPLSLAVAGLERRALRPGQPARVEPGRLLLGDRAVSLARTRERRPWVTTRAGLPAAAAKGALAVAGPPPESLVPGLVALRRNLIREAVGLLAGRGEGLTPAGDDALAGYAAWRHAIGAPAPLSALAAGRSSGLGLSYLRCAERGELPDAGARAIAALQSGDRPALAAAALALRSWGASSGTALLWGIAAGASRG